MFTFICLNINIKPLNSGITRNTFNVAYHSFLCDLCLEGDGDGSDQDEQSSKDIHHFRNLGETQHLDRVRQDDLETANGRDSGVGLIGLIGEGSVAGVVGSAGARA